MVAQVLIKTRKKLRFAAQGQKGFFIPSLDSASSGWTYTFTIVNPCGTDIKPSIAAKLQNNPPPTFTTLSVLQGDLEHALVHPTSHKWAFGAITELLDNVVLLSMRLERRENEKKNTAPMDVDEKGAEKMQEEE